MLLQANVSDGACKLVQYILEKMRKCRCAMAALDVLVTIDVLKCMTCDL